MLAFYGFVIVAVYAFLLFIQKEPSMYIEPGSNPEYEKRLQKRTNRTCLMMVLFVITGGSGVALLMYSFMFVNTGEWYKVGFLLGVAAFLLYLGWQFLYDFTRIQ